MLSETFYLGLVDPQALCLLATGVGVSFWPDAANSLGSVSPALLRRKPVGST